MIFEYCIDPQFGGIREMKRLPDNTPSQAHVDNTNLLLGIRVINCLEIQGVVCADSPELARAKIREFRTKVRETMIKVLIEATAQAETDDGAYEFICNVLMEGCAGYKNIRWIDLYNEFTDAYQDSFVEWATKTGWSPNG